MDGIGRLGSVTQVLAGGAFDNTTTFGYNAAGQIISRTQSNDTYGWDGHFNQTQSTPVNGLNQLSQVNGTMIPYDANANQSNSEDSWGYTYDSQNRLVTAAKAGASYTMAYDPLGMLRSITPSGGSSTDYLYDGPNLVAQYSGDTMLRRFVHGAGVDAPLVWYEGAATNAPQWLHPDERGSIVAVSDASGNATAQLTYSAYGETDFSKPSPFKYTGQLAIQELGLYYYKARFYSPKLGRFLQSDPIGYEGGMNLYGYVGGDPVNYTDPSGLMPQVDVEGSPCDPDALADATWWQKALCYRRHLLPPPSRQPPRPPHGPSGGQHTPQSPADQTQVELCYAAADDFGSKTGTIAGFTVAGAQRGPWGALAGLGVGVVVAGASDYFDGPGSQNLMDGAGAAVLDGPSGFIGAQYDAMARSLFSDRPGLAYPIGGAVGNTIAHLVRERALAGAGSAARWGLGAGSAYLGGYMGGFSLAYSQCMKN